MINDIVTWIGFPGFQVKRWPRQVLQPQSAETDPTSTGRPCVPAGDHETTKIQLCF